MARASLTSAPCRSASAEINDRTRSCESALSAQATGATVVSCERAGAAKTARQNVPAAKALRENDLGTVALNSHLHLNALIYVHIRRSIGFANGLSTMMSTTHRNVSTVLAISIAALSLENGRLKPQAPIGGARCSLRRFGKSELARRALLHPSDAQTDRCDGHALLLLADLRWSGHWRAGSRTLR